MLLSRHLLPYASILVAALCQDQGDVGGLNTLVSTSLGPVRGSEGKTEAGTRYTKYTRVPYAEPPIGELRLREPVGKRAWSSELDATKDSPPCLQIDSLAGGNSNRSCRYIPETPLSNSVGLQNKRQQKNQKLNSTQ